MNKISFETWLCCQTSVGSVSALKHYGIHITNNGLKIHGQPMIRRVAGRKGVRKREKQYASI